MFAKTASSLWIAGVVLAAVGCVNTAVDAPSPSDYRTIGVQPLRNTDAAKHANQIGLQKLAEGDLEKAEKAFRGALTADIEFGPAHNNLGKVYYKQKDWYRAAWEFEYAKKLLPRYAEPRNNLGLVLEATGQLDHAVDQYREAVDLTPDNIEYRANLARALIRRGDRTDEVRQLLQQIIQEDTRPEWLIWASQQQAGMGSKKSD